MSIFLLHRFLLDKTFIAQLLLRAEVCQAVVERDNIKAAGEDLVWMLVFMDKGVRGMVIKERIPVLMLTEVFRVWSLL